MNSQLITEYLFLLRQEAHKILRRAPEIRRQYELDDLVSAGIPGLLTAHKNYNPSTKTPFTAYARRRIWGSMTDWLRSTEWVNRRRRKITLKCLSFDNLDGEDVHFLAIMTDHQIDEAQRADLYEYLLSLLTKQQRYLLKNFYYRSRRIGSIAGSLHCGETTVSMIHRQLLNRLRYHLHQR